jgi:hypothetical protein
VRGSKTYPETDLQAVPHLASYKSEPVSLNDPETDPLNDPQPVSRNLEPEGARVQNGS